MPVSIVNVMCPKTIALVACSKNKDQSLSGVKAKDLYTSDLFTKSRAYAESHADQWLILSALLHIVDPEKLISCYDKSLVDQCARGRRIWGYTAALALTGILTPGTDVILLAGRVYRDALLPPLLARFPGITVSIPMEGMGIGQQLQFLKRANAVTSMQDVA